MQRTIRLPLAICLATLAASCGNAASFARRGGSPEVLTHVRVIDGTGKPGKDDQTIVMQHGRVTEVGSAQQVRIPSGAATLDLRGRTVIPGLVGMHEHLFYQLETTSRDLRYYTAQSPFAKLYLASGVTTIRTAGTIDLAGDVALKQRIDRGSEPGPSVRITSPYLDALGSQPAPDAIAREVTAYADQGVTWFKAAPTLRTAELRAAIRTAHDRGLRVTGHLCAVGFREAAALGIDNLEHGLVVDTEFYSGKQPDVCPDQGAAVSELAQMDVRDSEISGTIISLVSHGVAVTSTLPVFETFTARISALDPRTLTVLSPSLRTQYEAIRDLTMRPNDRSAAMWSTMLQKEMQFERAFVAAGGRLLAGVDPTGWGGAVAGFGDQRELELLVEAGFTPEQAIEIATSNGADFLRESSDIGTVAPGYRADLVVLRGNPSVDMSSVHRVEWVVKDGVMYDPDALVAAAAGRVGTFDMTRFTRWPLNVLGLLVIGLLALVVIRRWPEAPRGVVASTGSPGSRT